MKLDKVSFACPFSRASLAARFAFYSFLCIGIMTTTLWFVVSKYLTQQILEREWETTAQMLRADVRQLLIDYDFQATDRKSVGHKFEELLRHVTLMPDITRFKVYSPKGVVLWSDDKRLVGQSFADNEQLRVALEGNVVADMTSLKKAENLFDQNPLGSAIEIYVPIFAESKDLLGVIEIYKRPDILFRDIRQARLIVLLATLGGGVLLYISLFAIVRQAAKKIDEQQENLLKMQSELVASQRMAAVGEIAAAVAHGIGNPLSSIRAAAQVATLDAKSETDPEHIQKTSASLQSIMEQVDRVQKRMQGLLNFAKPMEPHPGSGGAKLVGPRCCRDVTTAICRRRGADESGTRAKYAEINLGCQSSGTGAYGLGHQRAGGHAQRWHCDDSDKNSAGQWRGPKVVVSSRTPARAFQSKTAKKFSSRSLPPNPMARESVCRWRRSLSSAMAA